jgi:hypothetical protein
MSSKPGICPGSHTRHTCGPMPIRSLARPASICSATAILAVSAVCAAAPPAVPPVVEIPVAPLPRAKKAAPAPTPAPTPAPATTTTVTTTTTVVAPPLSAIEMQEPAPAPGAAEAMPPAPAPVRVVMADETPFKAGHSRAQELPEHSARHAKKHGRHGRPFHPAPGIVVEVSGSPAASDLQRAARNLGYWPFRHCYEEGLVRNQQLAGSVSFTLSRQGSGTAAQLGQSSVHDESVTLCVVREAQRLELPWGDGASGASAAEVKVTLATGDEPVPAPHAVPHAEELREALHASWPALEQCYATELAKHADIGGRMELHFHEKPTGEIAEVSEDEPRFGDVEVTKCVLGVYRTAHLPHLHGSHDSSFVYSVHFEAAPVAPTASK